MFKVICCLLIGIVPISSHTKTISGTVKTDIVTAGGDCAHRWWLQPDVTGRRQAPLIALEPEEKVPPELNNRRVQVEGVPKVCHGVEGGSWPVLVIERIKPIEQ